MAEDARLRSPQHERDSILEWPQKNSSKSELEELRAKVNQLEYGGITADKLGGGTISTQSIQLAESASLYSGSTTADGFVLDVDGLRFYDGGVNTIDLRADGGTATFTGTITASTITGGAFQTALSGKRIVISSAQANLIEFYSGHLSETTPGLIKGDSAGDVLMVSVRSPKAGFDWCSSSLFGRSSGGVEAQWVVQMLDSAGVDLGNFIMGSKNSVIGGGSYLAVQGITEVRFDTETAQFQFCKVPTTNASQLRFNSINAGGVTQVAASVDNGAYPGQLTVMAFNGTTPMAIAAGAFNVISSADGKEKIKGRTDKVLDRVKQLRTVDYVRPSHALERVKQGDPNPGFAPETAYVGFLAEEMLVQFPEAVVRDVEGNAKAIDLMAVVAILTQAIQELA